MGQRSGDTSVLTFTCVLSLFDRVISLPSAAGMQPLTVQRAFKWSFPHQATF